jgi:hypothetical protein
MQKKLLLVLAIVVSALVSHAQVEKGNWLLGGSLGFSSTNNDASSGNSTSFNSSILPSLGWAIGKNAVIGLRGGFSTGTTKYETNNSKQTFNGYTAGAYWKMYFPFADKAGWYTNLGAGYNFNKFKYTNMGSLVESENSGYNFNFSPGVYYMPTKKIILSGGLGGLTYSHIKSSGNTLAVSTTSGFAFNVLNNFSFGIEFLLGKDHSNKM